MTHFHARILRPCPFAVILTLSFLFLGPAVSAHADTVHLKRGGSLEGDVVEGERTVEVRLEGGSTTFSRDEIERIDRTDPSADTRSPVLKTASEWSKKTSVWFNRTRLQAVRHWNGLQKKASGMMQPVGKSAAAQPKRALKKDGFNIS
jgi:hypothetical protein